MSDAVYVIESGKACVLHRDGMQEPAEILYLTKGDLFGESALNRGQPNLNSVVAASDLETLRIPLSNLEYLVESDTYTAHQLAKLIELRADATQRQINTLDQPS